VFDDDDIIGVNDVDLLMKVAVGKLYVGDKSNGNQYVQPHYASAGACMNISP
jgi:hypothetical protein